MSTDRGRPGPRGATRLRRRPGGDGLLIVGLVGRAGSGKSTVARGLAERGARVIEADRLGHEVTDQDPEVRAALIAEYGDAVYRADGTLNRARVASRVFSDAGSLQRLNALVHPRIVARIRERIESSRREKFRGVVVVDAALMLDWGFQGECDVVLAVVAPESMQFERLLADRGWPPEESRARLAAQPTRATFEEAADEVIDNDGNEDDLARKIAAVWERLAMRLT